MAVCQWPNALTVGGRLTLTLLGQPVEVEIANLRRVDSTRLRQRLPT